MPRVLDALISRQLKKLIEAEGGGVKSMYSANGVIELVDVMFSPDAIEELLEHETGEKLPISFEMLHVRTLKIVTADVLQGSIEIVVEDASILCRRTDIEGNSAEKVQSIKEWHIRSWMRKLLLETVAEQPGDETPSSGQPSAAAQRKQLKERSRQQWWLRSLLSRLQPRVLVKNIHVRYEELGHHGRTCRSPVPCAVGFVLGELSLGQAPGSAKLSDVSSSGF